MFHMLASIDSLASFGITAIADSAESADALYAHARTALARAGDRRAFRARTPRLKTALDMQG